MGAPGRLPELSGIDFCIYLRFDFHMDLKTMPERPMMKKTMPGQPTMEKTMPESHHRQDHVGEARKKANHA